MRAAAVIILLTMLDHALRRFGVQRMLLWADRSALWVNLLRRLLSAPSLPTACAQWVDAADRRFATVPGRCLPRSLLLYALLRATGYEPDFKVGVRTLTGVFESHAWIELEDTVLNDTPDVAHIYAPFSLVSKSSP